MLVVVLGYFVGCPFISALIWGVGVSTTSLRVASTLLYQSVLGRVWLKEILPHTTHKQLLLLITVLAAMPTLAGSMR